MHFIFCSGSVLDCVQCQQCKLHGKLVMLGYGAGLKLLFLPEDMFESSFTKNEIVAFINTLAKLSESIYDIKGLEEGYERFVEEEEREKERKRERERKRLLKPSSTNYINNNYDAIIVGSGLAGLSAALRILDRGGSVLIVEKEATIGGNSAKASSGMNAVVDTASAFTADTVKSAGSSANLPLISALVDGSSDALEWLRSRADVDLSLRARLGGHSEARTHRPSNGMAGAEIIYAMQREVKKFVDGGRRGSGPSGRGRATFLLQTTVVDLVVRNSDRSVVGVEYRPTGTRNSNSNNSTKIALAPAVILATGGFAADRSEGSILSSVRPDLLHFPTTAGAFSTGDGINLAAFNSSSSSIKAGLVDMAHVQLHPTGWVDPSDPSSPTKILAAELLRGVGGILVDPSGRRFCNELGTRKYVADKILARGGGKGGGGGCRHPRRSPLLT